MVSDDLVQGPSRQSSQEQQETVLKRRLQRSFKVRVGDRYTCKHCSGQHGGCSGRLGPITALMALTKYHLHTTYLSAMYTHLY